MACNLLKHDLQENDHSSATSVGLPSLKREIFVGTTRFILMKNRFNAQFARTAAVDAMRSMVICEFTQVLQLDNN